MSCNTVGGVVGVKDGTSPGSLDMAVLMFPELFGSKVCGATASRSSSLACVAGFDVSASFVALPISAVDPGGGHLVLC